MLSLCVKEVVQHHMLTTNRETGAFELNGKPLPRSCRSLTEVVAQFARGTKVSGELLTTPVAPQTPVAPSRVEQAAAYSALDASATVYAGTVAFSGSADYERPDDAGLPQRTRQAGEAAGGGSYDSVDRGLPAPAAIDISGYEAAPTPALAGGSAGDGAGGRKQFKRVVSTYPGFENTGGLDDVAMEI